MVIAMLLAHLVADYVLQWDRLAIWKSRELKGVLVHGLIVLIVTWVFSFAFDPNWWPWVVFIGLTHTTVDAIRLRLGDQFSALSLYILDQTVHMSLIGFALYSSGYLMAPSLRSDLSLALIHNRALLFILGYVFVSIPAWILLRFVVYGLTAGLAPDFSDTPNKYASSLERGLVVTAVLLGQFILVPLVTLPRLVFEGTHVQDSQRSALYLTEWLASVALAMAVGLWLRQM